MIVEISLQHRPQPSALLLHCVMHPQSQFLGHILQLAPEPFLYGLPYYEEFAVFGLTAYVRHTKKVKRLRLAAAPFLAICSGESSKLDYSRLVRVQL